MAVFLESVLELLGLAADYNDNDRRRVASIIEPVRVLGHSSHSVARYKVFLHYAFAHPRSWTPLREVLWQTHKVRSKL